MMARSTFLRAVFFTVAIASIALIQSSSAYEHEQEIFYSSVVSLKLLVSFNYYKES